MAQFSLSPAVTITEFDETIVVPTVASIGAGFVGQFHWGPVNQIVDIDQETTLVNRFERPGANTYLSFFSAANYLAYSSSLKVVRSIGTGANNATADGTGILIKNDPIWEASYMSGGTGKGPWAARFPGSFGNSLFVSICPSANAFSQTMVALANTTSGSNIAAFSANVATVLTAGDLLTVGSIGTYPVVSVAANGLIATINTNFTATVVSNTASRKWAYFASFTGAPGTSTYANSVNGVADQLHVVVIDQNGLFSTGRGTSVTTGSGANTKLELYPFVSKASDAKNSDGTTNYYRDVIFQKSKYVHWMDHMISSSNWGNTAPGTTYTDTNLNSYKTLSGGITSSPADADLETSWDLFVNADQVDVQLLITGNASSTVSNYVISNIAMVRNDAIAFVSPQQNDVVNAIGNETTNCVTSRNLLPSSQRGFMDCNWKYMLDKYNNLYRWVPLNGDIAGLVARTAATRDVFYSPAGYSRGQIKNVIKLAWSPYKTQRDTLYNAQINPVFADAGQGILLFGDKTLFNQPSAFSRINVRELFDVIEKAIATASKFSMFEFNDEFTRAAFVNMVTPYLRGIQGRRGITGFKVKCDAQNNPQSVIDNENFVGTIIVSPARAINNIGLNFVAAPTGVTFEEFEF